MSTTSLPLLPEQLLRRRIQRPTHVQLDDKVCLCFHVTKRKLVNYIRIERPKRAAQLSECFGAGTGCGWCRGYLTLLFEAAVAGEDTVADEPTPADYAQLRAKYIRGGGGTPPPGATPIEPDQHPSAPHEPY